MICWSLSFSSSSADPCLSSKSFKRFESSSNFSDLSFSFASSSYLLSLLKALAAISICFAWSWVWSSSSLYLCSDSLHDARSSLNFCWRSLYAFSSSLARSRSSSNARLVDLSSASYFKHCCRISLLSSLFWDAQLFVCSFSLAVFSVRFFSRN